LLGDKLAVISVSQIHLNHFTLFVMSDADVICHDCRLQ